MDLTASVTSLGGVGTITAGKLAKLGVNTVFDLLYHLPFRYEDRRQVSLAKSARVGETTTVIGTISAVKNVFTKNGKRLQTATFTDASGTLTVIWFNQMYLSRVFTPGTEVALFGKVDFFSGRPALISPEYELVTAESSAIHLRRLVPIYPETAGLTSKWLRTKIYYLLPQLEADFMPSNSTKLQPWAQALHAAHFPSSLEGVTSARHRLAFDELLLLELAAKLRREKWAKTRLAHPFQIDQEKVLEFINRLPFALTGSQNQSTKEILADLSKPIPMNRLLAGDVGSGKTVVAAVGTYVAHLNGWSSLVMAPTQILATQHFHTLSALFAPLGIKVELVTGSRKLPKDSQWDILVGTHALFSQTLQLTKVGLVVIDEQHRFGVAQRTLATSLGKSPHILTMTATPIPRTVALTMYGDLDLSTLSDLPIGRLPVKTWVVPEPKREASYTWIAQQMATTHSQAFWVCPFIDQSDSLTSVKAATVEFEKLKKVFGKFKLALLHGKMKAADKDKVIASFQKKEIDMVVATPVVEVGLDIPGANIMVIEGADRFGLAGLHQLRGRVGRSSQQAYCLLFADSATPRLQAMEKYHSGQQLAEMDLKLRGAGELYGTAQHGSVQFKVATYADFDLLPQAKAAAQQLFPKLSKLPTLRSLVATGKIELVQPN
ncbi:MAG: ATP-dependent DNA helicase RecG [bacterium]|nr:ATP-dependent DNA helicase RecG [bacterium]